MQLCNHDLHQGNGTPAPSWLFHMMDVDSYQHHVMSNDSLRERVLKHFSVLSRTLAHKDCTIIPQLQFDNNIIEVLGGMVFQISSRSFVSCPIRPECIGKISPRSFVEYDSTTIPDAGYFEDAIINSFPDHVERVNFLNKFYQCLVAGKTPLKVRKLVVAGPRDSGKTSWSAIFHRVIPAQYIATITKERQFSAAMMNEFTQLVIIDEWSTSSMDSELAKTVLQGGWMKTSVKHQRPRCFFSTCPFYITANEVPDFGDEQENVLRRVILYETESLPATNLAAEKWMYDNAMHCIAWMAGEINGNLEVVDANERWYEDPENAAITNFPSRESCQHIAAVSHEELHQNPFNAIAHVSPPAIHSTFHRVAESVGEKRATRILQSSSSSDECSIQKKSLRRRPQIASSAEGSTPSSQENDARPIESGNSDKNAARSSGANTAEHPGMDNAHKTSSPAPHENSGRQPQTDVCRENSVGKAISEGEETNDQEDENHANDSKGFYSLSPTQWQLNTNAYFARVAGYITTQFYGHEFKGKPTLAFNARIDNAPRKERDFYTKADPNIDTWMLILAKPRNVFDLEAFVKKYPNIDGHLAELRKIVRCRVLHESCPIVNMKMQLARQSDEARKRKATCEPLKLNIKRRASRRK